MHLIATKPCFCKPCASPRLTRLLWVPLTLGLLAGGCSDSTDDENKGLSASGFCADSCPKACSEDTECDTANGELCCDFGGEGTACVKAASCPRFCQSDSECDTAAGDACLRVLLDSPKKICTRPQQAIKVCTGDGGCDTGSGEVCCSGVYSEAICQPAASCPTACGQSSDCDTAAGETCCTTYQQLFPYVTSGLCAATEYAFCPKACQRSEDCNTADGEICCDGLCSASCSKSCSESNQCSGQLCCKTKAAQSIWFNWEASWIGGGGGGGGKGDGDICEQAQQKLTRCGWTAEEPIGSCTATDACTAACILDASCTELQEFTDESAFILCVNNCPA